MRNMPTRSEHSGCWRRHKCNSLGKMAERFAAIHILLRKHRLQVMGSVFTRAEVDKAYEQTAELMTRTIPHQAGHAVGGLGLGAGDVLQWIAIYNVSGGTVGWRLQVGPQIVSNRRPVSAQFPL